MWITSDHLSESIKEAFFCDAVYWFTQIFKLSKTGDKILAIVTIKLKATEQATFSLDCVHFALQYDGSGIKIKANNASRLFSFKALLKRPYLRYE